MEESRWFPFAFLVGFPLFWIAICELLGFMGGWRRLAEVYPSSGPVPSDKAWFRSGKLGLVNYGNCLVLGFTPAGLYLATVFPFRPGHAPLLIPWSEIHASAEEEWAKQVRLRFSRSPSVSLRLYGVYPEILGRASGAEPL